MAVSHMFFPNQQFLWSNEKQIKNHRIIDPLKSEKTSKVTESSSEPSTVNSIPKHIPKCNIHTPFEHFKDGSTTTSQSSHFQCRIIFSVKHFFPNICSKPPLEQLEAFTFVLVLCRTWNFILLNLIQFRYHFLERISSNLLLRKSSSFIWHT